MSSVNNPFDTYSSKEIKMNQTHQSTASLDTNVKKHTQRYDGSGLQTRDVIHNYQVALITRRGKHTRFRTENDKPSSLVKIWRKLQSSVRPTNDKRINITSDTLFKHIH